MLRRLLTLVTLTCLLSYISAVPSWAQKPATAEDTLAAVQAAMVRRVADPAYPLSLPVLKAQVSWIGNSFPGDKGNNFIPLTVDTMTVLGDGTVFTGCHYNEAYSGTILIKDGKYVGASTGEIDTYAIVRDPYSHDREGRSVVLYGRYGSNQGMYSLLENGTEFTLENRFDLSHPLKPIQDLRRATFGRNIYGIATTPTHIYLAAREGSSGPLETGSGKGELLVWNRTYKPEIDTTPVPVAYPVPGLGNLVADTDGLLWAIQEKPESPGSFQVIQLSTGGKVLATLTGLGNPTGIAIDHWGRLLVTDSAPDARNIKVFDTETGKQVATFGTVGGIYGAGNSVRGRRKNAAFTVPRSVGVDDAGNLYVLDVSASWPQNIVIAKYPRAKTGKGWLTTPTWTVGGGVFADIALPDPRDSNTFYTAYQRYTMDWKKDTAIPGSGTIAQAQPGFSWAASLTDFDKFPGDARANYFLGLRSTRKIFYAKDKAGKEHKYIVSGNLEWSELGVPSVSGVPSVLDVPEMGYGDTAVPRALMLLRPIGMDGPSGWPDGKTGDDSGYSIWTDKNGDGQYSPDEFSLMSPGGWDRREYMLQLSHIDDAGGVWFFPKHDEKSGRGYYYPLTGIISGAPVYTAESRIAFTLPKESGFKWAYSSLNETTGDVYLTSIEPNTDRPALHRLRKYAGLRDVIKSRAATGVKSIDLSTITPKWSAVIGRGDRYTPRVTANSIDGDRRDIASVSAAGDYVFAAEGTGAGVRVYRTSDGSLVGRLDCGTLAANAPLDSTTAFRAFPITDGANKTDITYLIIVGDYLHNKNVIYRWHP